MHYSYAKNNPDSRGFNNCTKDFIIINPLSLRKAFCNKPNLISRYGSIWILLDSEYPLIVYNFDWCRRLNQRPSLIGLQ